MRIPVGVEFFAGGLRPMVTLCIKSDEPKVFGVARAIIDTGSPTTILGIDFLLAGKFKFFFYPEKRESYLECED